MEQAASVERGQLVVVKAQRETITHFVTEADRVQMPWCPWRGSRRSGVTSTIRVGRNWTASAGSPSYDPYEVTPVTGFGLGMDEPFGATRWRF
jgi:hypothetical protein